jgi:hypothetical protein
MLLNASAGWVNDSETEDWREIVDLIWCEVLDRLRD